MIFRDLRNKRARPGEIMPGTISIILASIIAILTATGSGTAVAQTNDADEALIEEIIVTAQRREQSLQNVPISQDFPLIFIV